MGINFPLILVLVTAFTGAIWLIDIFFLRKKRQSAAEKIRQRLGKNSDAAAEPVEKALAQPVIVEYSISFFPVLLFVLILRSFLFEPFQIPTGSMIPSLLVGDFVVVNKFDYGIRLPVIRTKIINIGEPKRGDVMVFIAPPNPKEYYIKRVIGVPGDTVRYADKKLYINGALQKQTLVTQSAPVEPKFLKYQEDLTGVDHLIQLSPDSGTRGPEEWVIRKGHYFVMGDNRDLSDDSRYWGTVPEQAIVGKAVAVWMHKEPGFHLPQFGQDRLIR